MATEKGGFLAALVRRGAESAAMTFPEYLEQVKGEWEGDSWFKLLRERLASGHAVLSVRVVAERDQRPMYEFALAKLGAITTVQVPVGGPAVERFLFAEPIKLATLDDEVRRCAANLTRHVVVLGAKLGAGPVRAGLEAVTRALGGPRSAALVGAAQAPRDGQAARAAEVSIRREVDGYVGSLFAEAGYSTAEAGDIMDRALEAMLRPVA